MIAEQFAVLKNLADMMDNNTLVSLELKTQVSINSDLKMIVDFKKFQNYLHQMN